jgi:hypothetical protein
MARACHDFALGSYASPLEAIRFAAANRLLVELDYENERRERGRRVMEPYALRRTRGGDLLLYAVRSDSGDLRSYRVDRIRETQVQQQSFVERYAVEQTASGPLSAPSTAARGMSASVRPAFRPRVAPPSLWTSTRTGRTASGGPTCVFECPICEKRFMRKQMVSALDAHKNKQGFDCPGRTGVYQGTRY